MSVSGSSNTMTESGGQPSVLAGPLHIPGYHFKAAPTPSLAHGENVDVVYGYKISNRSPVVAKVSSVSLRLEREFYIMKRLYQFSDGPLYIVRPIEHIRLPSGLTVVIYANEGQNYLSRRRPSDEYHRSAGTSDRASSVGSSNSGTAGSTASDWLRTSNIENNLSANAPSYDLGTFLQFAIKCTDGLEFIHRHGVVHGEVRLAAFQWTGEDATHVKMWNFGSSIRSLETYLTSEGWRKAANSKESMSMLQNLLVYMSPEQTGRTNYAPDHRADIYSLGIVFFVLLTGRIPFDGGPLEILNGIVSRKIALVHELQLNVPEVLSRIIEKMTAKAPDERYSSAHGVRADLKECLRRLKAAEETSTESIPSFPLAQRDIASVFTLPKTIYGRQSIISEATYIIEQYAGLYKSTRTRSRDKSSYANTNSTQMAAYISNGGSTADTMSDTSGRSSNGGLGPKSNASPSYCSGLDGSDVSSTMNGRTVMGKKQYTTIVGLYGPGGAGKSTVMNAVLTTARQNGYVATTKFDSRHRGPYVSILRVLSQILQQILSETEEEINAFYNHLKSHLGSQFCNVEQIAELVPELKPLLEPKGETREASDFPHMDNVETRIRFHNTFVEVFRSISLWRMTTLFLDDLHQADEASLELIQSLVNSRVKLLVFGSYRDEEATPQLLKLLESELATTHFFKIDMLDFDSLVDLLCDTLHRSRDANREAVIPLADVIMNKTRGNPFYTAQILRTLERKKLIFFNWEDNTWDYNLLEIQQNSIFETNDLVGAELDTSFLTARLRELPRDARLLVKWASFIGDTFSWSTVRSLMSASDSDFSSETSSEKSDDTAQYNTPTTDHEQDQDQDQDIDVESLHPLIKFSHTVSTPPRGEADGRKDRQQNMHSGPHQKRKRNPIHGLQAVLQEGFILPMESDEFKWSHDRISQAAMELVNPEIRSKIHFRIADHMMKQKDVDTFLIADHLLKCADIIRTVEDKAIYRNVLIEAGKKARSSGAHHMAYSYNMAAIKLIEPDEAWTQDYTATQALYSAAASLSWVVGEYECTEELLDVIFQHVKGSMDRITAYRIQAKYYFSRTLHKEGRHALERCLKELGVEHFSSKANEDELDHEYGEAMRVIKEVGLDNVVKIGPCEDINLRTTLAVLEEYFNSSYWNGNLHQVYYLACRSVHLSITHGMSQASGCAFEFMGICAVQHYKMHAYGEELGAAGVAIAEQHSTYHEKGRAMFLYGQFLQLWKYHQREVMSTFRTAYWCSASAGDRIYSSFSHFHIAEYMFMLGDDMSEALLEAEKCYQDVHSWSSSADSNMLVMTIIRAIKALQGHTFTDTAYVYDGDDGFSDEHFVSETKRQSTFPDVPFNLYVSWKMLVWVLYGHYDAAIEHGYQYSYSSRFHPCHKHTMIMNMAFSLALVQKCRSGELDEETRKKHLKQIQCNQDELQEWMNNSRVNFVMYWTLVQAELSTLTHPMDTVKCIQLYEDAINMARENGYYLDLCMNHEFAGAFYHRMGMKNVAYGFIKKAIDLWMSISAYGKARHLTAKYNELLADVNDERVEPQDVGVQTDPFPFLGPQNAWSTSSSVHNTAGMNEPYASESIPPVTTEQTLMTLDILDMASILKSSQVMSSEVKFDGLLKSMIAIILENSGADCGAIIVKEEKYGVCAYGSQQEGSTTYDPPQPLSEDDSLVSSRIIHHTIHTGESIFINNVEQDPRFAIGPWFERVQNKSVICMPIIHKSAMAGCLFIEGAVGIFTQRHITVLSLLCQQMGISITNAFLFKSVQRVTITNMRMIEMQKQALEDARKSREAAVRATRLREIFLANMSHEIRTPFSGFYGMISLLAETRLDPEQRDLVKTAKESCEILLQIIDDLLNFSKLQAGKVSLDLSPVVVEEVVADVVEMLVAMAIQKDINVTYSVSSDVPAVVMADANRLRQIIINLLGNAIKFTHQGEICIRCSVDKRSSRTAEDKVALLFEVTDTGIGISEEQRKVLFAPFSQVDGSTTRKYGGTGLGLSICLQLVQLMSGRIDVTSEPGKGSNFHFTIRVSRVQDQSMKRNNVVASFLHELRDIHVLVASKYTSTCNMIRQMMPCVSVDGVTAMQDLIAREQANKTYQVVIVGLFLTHDPEFSQWSEVLHRVIKKSRCLIIMHYPSGAVGDLLGKSHFSLVDTHGRLQSAEQLERSVVRMAVPLRRQKLLGTIVDLLKQTTASPENTPRPTVLSSTSGSKSSEAGTKLISCAITPEERALFSTMHILAAEDNPVAQKLLYKQLTRLSFQVECANNGQEAVEAWLRHPEGYFKMGFFDHHMPKCDGVEATKRIRSIETREGRKQRLPIVALTADVQDSARETCMKAGMDAYLTKPLNQNVLADALRRFCKPTAPSPSSSS